MLERGEPLRSSYRLISREDGVVWFHCEAKMVPRDERRHRFVYGVAFMIGSPFDLAERRRLEKAVLENGAREQLRIGQDLHDRLGQLLTGIAFLSKVQLDLGATDPKTGKQSASVRVPITNHFTLIGGLDLGGNFRGQLRYIIRFK